MCIRDRRRVHGIYVLSEDEPSIPPPLPPTSAMPREHMGPTDLVVTWLILLEVVGFSICAWRCFISSERQKKFNEPPNETVAFKIKFLRLLFYGSAEQSRCYSYLLLGANYTLKVRWYLWNPFVTHFPRSCGFPRTQQQLSSSDNCISPRDTGDLRI
eukprot:TRINITY_DN1985_c0_g1_i1.p3 TRINITY_DN1985_c0_g1~~TRINITY_DN1985_c0_g1_i1.p3  ORF type:complete len:157 (+),score=4.96 TRINITY_DN1985_c0_g1_i1:64-534(+)